MNIKKSIAVILMFVLMGFSSLPLTTYAGGTHPHGTYKEKVFKKHAHHRTKRIIQKRQVRAHAKKHVRRHIRKRHTN